jgi:hypothetical protein
VYLNTLRKAEEQLAVLQPEGQGDEDDDEEEEGAEEGDNAAQWQPIQVCVVCDCLRSLTLLVLKAVTC